MRAIFEIMIWPDHFYFLNHKFCKFGKYVSYFGNWKIYLVRPELCQKFYTTSILDQKIYILKTCRSRLFSLIINQCKCINISNWVLLCVKIDTLYLVFSKIWKNTRQKCDAGRGKVLQNLLPGRFFFCKSY